MNEKQRTRRIRHELDKAKAELARQDREIEALEAEVDPESLAEAERTFANPESSEARAVERLFAEQLPRVPSSTRAPKLSRFVIRV